MDNNVSHHADKPDQQNIGCSDSICCPNQSPETAVRQHFCLLGHQGYGVTELRTFDGVPMVAYVDSEDDMVDLCLQMNGKKSGIYVGAQPRPLFLFERAPNCWKPAHGKPDSNCACDNDIEYITVCFFDIDVVSPERQSGYPASDEELKYSLEAAHILSEENGLAMSSAICCSGNGHYVVAPIVPIPVDCDEIATQFQVFCQELPDKVSRQVTHVKLDPVFNLSRVMRVMGTLNGKGEEGPGRAHRRAYFVTEPIPAMSMALHYMILNTDTPNFTREIALEGTIKGNLKKLENCEFIQWCRNHPTKVSEPQWFGLLSSLAYLDGGVELAHAISRLDSRRYDYQQTRQVIERILKTGYQPVSCERLSNPVGRNSDYGCFSCSKKDRCSASAPMYMAALRVVYRR